MGNWNYLVYLDGAARRVSMTDQRLLRGGIGCVSVKNNLHASGEIYGNLAINLIVLCRLHHHHHHLRAGQPRT